MNKKLSFLAAACLLGSMALHAVPAKPGVQTFVQPDGTVVEATLCGDEHFHFFETAKGEILLRDTDGTLRPACVNSLGQLEARGTITGIATPAVRRQAIVNAGRAAVEARQAEAARAAKARRANKPAPIKQKFPTTGTVTGLVIMVEYQDVKFTEAATVEHYTKVCNTPGYKTESTAGSVIDYFTEQSGGKFTPKFDVVGPYTLSQNRAFYGITGSGFNEMFREACMLADADGLDFSKYDLNEDGFIDFVFLVFAGHSEAQGGPYECVWPAMQYFENYIFDYFDGLQLNLGACACELKGATGTTLDGVGTICHEFSHVIGLPDVYDSGNSGGYGMGHFDIMDIGTYNDDQITPSGYTAMDKYQLEWNEPLVLDETTKEVTLRPSTTSHDCAFIVNPDNDNEYFILENRQQQGWDKGIPGHGLVITYCHYDAKIWKRNTVNSPVSSGYEHISIRCADNVWDATLTNEAGDPFPGTKGVTEFSGKSQPQAIWMSTKTPMVGKVYNIRENNDGTVTFNYAVDAAGIDDVAADTAAPDVRVDGNNIIAPAGSQAYDLTGRATGLTALPAGIYIVHTTAGAVKVRI